MADAVYDVIVCGSGSGGGFFAGEVAPYGSMLILEAGPNPGGAPNYGVGSPGRRKFSTQINLGQYQPADVFNTRGSTFFSYPFFMIEANQINASTSREARVVGGGSAINVGAWIRPRIIDWPGFEAETGVKGWTKAEFERHFLKAETILSVRRDVRENWNKASVLYEQAANALGIQTVFTASNRKNCIFCGHRLNAGMPCKYDSLMSTAITQIPKAQSFGATLIDNATVEEVIIENNRAVGVRYVKDRQSVTVRANKLVVVAAGAIGSPLLLRSSGLHLKNDNVGRYLKAHPGVPLEVLMPPGDWNSDRGYQWNLHHYASDDQGQLVDILTYASASFPSNTPWVGASVGFFGQAYKDLMRKFPQRAGAFLFEMKPGRFGRVMGTVDAPEVFYPVVDKTGVLEKKTLDDLVFAANQAVKVYKSFGAIESFPAVDAPPAILHQQLTLFITTSGAIHNQGTCRAAADRKLGVVDTYGMSFDVDGLMVCDASVIPQHISSNPNALIMALANRQAEYAITQVLGKSLNPSYHIEPDTQLVADSMAANGEVYA
jgi:choline dehydrogenase